MNRFQKQPQVQVIEPNPTEHIIEPIIEAKNMAEATTELSPQRHDDFADVSTKSNPRPGSNEDTDK